MQQQIVASGEMRALQVNLINAEGAVEPTDVMALGNFALLAPQGFVNWKSDKGFAIPYAKLPEGAPTLDTLRSQHAISMIPVLIDPTRGCCSSNTRIRQALPIALQRVAWLAK